MQSPSTSSGEFTVFAFIFVVMIISKSKGS